MSILELKNITFTYEDEETPIFQDFCFSLDQGQCVAVEGENGAGKTTLFRILNGLIFPQSGSFFFDGTEITREYLKNNKNRKLFHKRIGYLFQNPDVMLFNATVYDEVAFGPRQMGFDEKDIKTRTEDCLKLFDLESLAEKAPYHLSGGQKKRVALAAVTALNPEVLVLDEPFAGLDTNAQKRLMEFLFQWKAAGKTILIATHDPIIREQLADCVLTLSQVQAAN